MTKVEHTHARAPERTQEHRQAERVQQRRDDDHRSAKSSDGGSGAKTRPPAKASGHGGKVDRYA